MERKKFYTKIDQVAKEWYIDANPPVKGTWTSKLHQKGVVRRKTNQRGEENPINETSGEVQIMQWDKPEQMCIQCCKMVCDKREEINLRSGQIKCNCGLKYPIVNIETIS
jgi:hypothetical protein